jgi:hypothetical protein
MTLARTSSTAELGEVRKTSNWSELIALHDELVASGRWIYRGHSRADWKLQSGLERAIARFDKEGKTAAQLEAGLIRQFARRAHHYLADAPGRAAWTEWLALMQHHGAPTRLVDFTYSFYVAVFFALEEAMPDNPCAIWALNFDWADEGVRRIVGDGLFNGIYNGSDRNIEGDGTFKEFFASHRKMVFGVNPYRLNQRLSIQQGLFLCPGDVSSSFEDNLAALGSPNGGVIKCEISLSRGEYQNCVRQLIRMNMTRTSLFPGLDGFALSQKMALANPSILLGDPLYPT